MDPGVPVTSPPPLCKPFLQPISVQCVDPRFLKHDSPVHDSTARLQS